MKGFAEFAETVSVPLGLLNVLVGIVAGIWLAILGRWDLLGYGLLAIFVAGLVAAGFARRPGLLLDVPAIERRRSAHRLWIAFLSVLGSGYRVAVITGWCVGVLVFFAWRGSGDEVAALTWSYTIAAGPIVWMDQNEIQGGGGRHAAVITLFAQLAYVLVVLGMVFGELVLGQAAGLFAAIMVIGLMVLMLGGPGREEPVDPA